MTTYRLSVFAFLLFILTSIHVNAEEPTTNPIPIIVETAYYRVTDHIRKTSRPELWIHKGGKFAPKSSIQKSVMTDTGNDTFSRETTDGLLRTVEEQGVPHLSFRFSTHPKDLEDGESGFGHVEVRKTPESGVYENWPIFYSTKLISSSIYQTEVQMYTTLGILLLRKTHHSLEYETPLFEEDTFFQFRGPQDWRMTVMLHVTRERVRPRNELTSEGKK